jgi:phosphonate transport system permease protein
MSTTDSLEPPRTTLRQTGTYFLGWAVVLAILAWSASGADLRVGDLVENADNMMMFGKGFFPPNFSQWRMLLQEMMVTVQIAIWGSALAVVAAIPFGILSSENLVPWWVYQPVRRLMDMLRAINEMVFALLFVVAVGLGPFAGVLALFVHTTGVLAKLFSEAVEAIDHRPVEGIRATGAAPVHEVIYGVIPQVLPLWISYSLYRFESNVRSATVLGIVGAGGIGQILWEYIRGFYYAETAAVIIIIVATVSLLDLFSQRVRKAVI